MLYKYFSPDLKASTNYSKWVCNVSLKTITVQSVEAEQLALA